MNGIAGFIVDYNHKEVVVKYCIDNANIIVCVDKETWSYFVIENGFKSPELPFGKPENGAFPTAKEVTKAFNDFKRLSTCKEKK